MSRYRHDGFSMVEVMVAIVIFSFALLGLAGAQAAALKNQKTAHFRTAASQYAAEMADKLRANLVEARKEPNGGNTTSAYANDGIQFGSLGANVPNPCEASACTSAQIAALDLYNWRGNLAKGMRNGWGEVTGDAQNGYKVYVYYRELTKVANASNPATEPIDPNCRAATISTVSKNNEIRCFVEVVLP